MMKKMISWLSFMAVILSLYSCRNDVFPEKEVYSNNSNFQLTSKRISLSDSKHKTKLIPFIDKAQIEIEDKLKNKQKGNSRIISYGNGVSINTDDVIYIENGPGYHTYTFRIERENELPDAPVENLLLSPLSDGTYKEILISYALSDTEKQTLANGGFVDTRGRATFTDVEKGTFNANGELAKNTGYSCGYEDQQIWVPCSEHVHDQTNVSDWTECEAMEGPRMYTQIMWVCHLNTDAGTEDQPGGGGGSGIPVTGVGGDGCSNPSVYTSIPDPNQTSGCGGSVTLINLSHPQQTPCEKIKTQRNDDSFKKRMDTLQGKTGLKKETGYIQKWGGTYEYKDNASATPTANSLSLPEVATNTYIKGFAHTHVDNYEFIDPADGETKIKIGIKNFSPADVAYFMDLIQNAQTKGHPLSDVYGVMISSGVNYQIRFTGNQYQIKTFTDAQMESHRDPYIRLMKPYIDTPKKLEFGFLKYIDEKMNLKGITLYRMNTDGSNTEIKLNADKTNTVETNCPN